MLDRSTLAVHACTGALFTAVLACTSAAAASAQTQEPIKIGVIAEESAIAGSGISKGAQMAADAINAAGGVNGRQVQLVIYDDHSSASDAVRAFQRAVSEDKVVAVVGHVLQRGGAGAGALGGAHACAVHHHRSGQQQHQQAGPRRLRAQQIHVPRVDDIGLHRRTRSATPCTSSCSTHMRLPLRWCSARTRPGPRRWMPSTWNAFPGSG